MEVAIGGEYRGDFARDTRCRGVGGPRTDEIGAAPRGGDSGGAGGARSDGLKVGELHGVELSFLTGDTQRSAYTARSGRVSSRALLVPYRLQDESPDHWTDR